MRKQVRREFVEAESMAEERRRCAEQMPLLSREFASFNYGYHCLTSILLYKPVKCLYLQLIVY